MYFFILFDDLVIIPVLIFDYYFEKIIQYIRHLILFNSFKIEYF